MYLGGFVAGKSQANYFTKKMPPNEGFFSIIDYITSVLRCFVKKTKFW